MGPRRVLSHPAQAGLVAQAVWNDTAVISEFLHYSLMKGNVLLGRAVGCSMDIQFAGEFLAGGHAGIQVQQLKRSTIELW
jgi:hypothetical protein